MSAGPIVNPTNGHSYYLLSESGWLEAEAMAVSMGGHLATIRNASEDAWIWNTFKPLATDDYFMFGLTDQAQEGTWVWISGDPSTYRNWGATEPSSIASNDDYTQYFPYGAYEGKWNSIVPSDPGRGIVEIILPAVIASVYNPANGNKYYLLTNSTWTQAEAAAVALGGHLATIDDSAENTFIWDLWGTNRDLWIGLRTTNGTVNVSDFGWASGKTNSYSNWRQGEPNYGYGADYYTYIYGKDVITGSGLWNNAPDVSSLPAEPLLYGVVEVPGPAASLISYWSADGNATDSVSGHNGTLYGDVTYTNGVFGQAFNIVPSSAGSRVRIEDSSDFANPSFTVAGWINTRVHAGHMLVRGDSRAGLDNYIFSLYEQGKLQLIICGTNNASVTITAPLQLNRWTHFAGTFDNATGALKLYINGELKAQTNTTLRPVITLQSAFNAGIGLGNVADFSNFNINGMMDEIGIYSRALTADEIKPMYDVADNDGDGLLDSDENTVYHTDPTKSDTDGDGLSDGAEVYTYLTNPLSKDTDNDGLSDASEIQVYLTNPRSADTDGDGYSDYAELYAGKKPNDANDHPGATLSLFTAVELEFIGKTNTTYYIQSSPDMTTWTNYDGPILGDGGIWKKLYSTRDAAKQYFRVEAAQ